MPYLFNTAEDQREMLEAIGAKSIEELFEQVPAGLRLDRPLDMPPAMGELELTQHMQMLSAKNLHVGNSVCFLGAGSYDHFIPATVDTIGSRSEFYTSYTPYQAEVSQGNLQAMFEYQTLICQLTGMDVSNASLYDGGSSVAEAAMMCLAVTKRFGKVVVPDTLHPEYRQILETYFTNLETAIETVTTEGGVCHAGDLAAAVDDDTACVIVQYPNFFGNIEDVAELAEAVHAKGAKLVVSFDPISMGLLKLPGELGADVVIAEGQSLGSPMQYGGPYLGIIAAKESFIRRMPGRIAGETIDRRGKRCWVLTLQTREQHIRRDKATSNICSNQGLFALRASVYLALLGPVGMQETAHLCAQKAHYALEQITKSDRFEAAFPDRPFLKEFLVRDKAGNVEQLLAECRADGILAGVPVGAWYPELADCFLVCVTEKRTKAEIDRLAAALHAAKENNTVHA
jgi:glycine dehydrogenase subunit 1